jgi:hypothetical protein
MGEAGARLVSRFGPAAEGWLGEVPAVAARLASRWGLVLGEPFESGASSIVMRCRSRVIAPMFAIAYLTYDGSEQAIDELLALTR